VSYTEGKDPRAMKSLLIDKLLGQTVTVSVKWPSRLHGDIVSMVLEGRLTCGGDAFYVESVIVGEDPGMPVARAYFNERDVAEVYEYETSNTHLVIWGWGGES